MILRAKTSVGVSKARHLRGRLFNCRAIAFRWRWEICSAACRACPGPCAGHSRLVGEAQLGDQFAAQRAPRPAQSQGVIRSLPVTRRSASTFNASPACSMA